MHPLVAISGCVGGTSFSWGVSQSPPPLWSPPGRGEGEALLGRGCGEYKLRALPPIRDLSLTGAYAKVGVGDDFSLPEALFEGPEHGGLKWFP